VLLLLLQTWRNDEDYLPKQETEATGLNNGDKKELRS
jgi:hypothetical protein